MKYKFEAQKVGYKVSLRGHQLGEILPMKEVSGRHCFYLGCDKRKEPRTYRGMGKAADALLAISKLQAEAKKKKWSMDTLIVNAWDKRPSASENPG